jgi:hypothetical protein
MKSKNMRMHSKIMEEYFHAKIDFMRSVLVSNYHVSDEEIKEFIINCDNAFHDGVMEIIKETRSFPETLDAAISIGAILDKSEKED